MNGSLSVHKSDRTKASSMTRNEMKTKKEMHREGFYIEVYFVRSLSERIERSQIIVEDRCKVDSKRGEKRQNQMERKKRAKK